MAPSSRDAYNPSIIVMLVPTQAEPKSNPDLCRFDNRCYKTILIMKQVFLKYLITNPSLFTMSTQWCPQVGFWWSDGSSFNFWSDKNDK